MMQMSNFYHAVEVKEMATLVTLIEQLVIKGLRFRVHDNEGWWIIELTGGY